MKKLHELIKPFLAVILGALLLLIYMNGLGSEGKSLALAIVGVVFAAFYIGAGIMRVLLSDKLKADVVKILDVAFVGCYALLMFVGYILKVIDLDAGPTGWFIVVLSLASSIGFVVLFALATFLRNKNIKQLAQLFGFIFLLALVLNFVFDDAGNPVALGFVAILDVVVLGVYSSLLISSITSLGELRRRPKVEAEPEEEKAE